MEMQISVRAIPPPGNLYRRRAGRPWPAEPVIVKVVDSPKPHKLNAKGQIEEFSDEITRAQYAELQRDPHINAYPVGDPNAAPVLDAQAALAEKDREIAALRKELSGYAEIATEERRAIAAEAEEAGKKVQALESEVERLRAQLAKRHKA